MRILLGLIFVFVCQFIQGQNNNYNNFISYLQRGDTLEMKALLGKWEKENPNDPELFTSYYNYYISQSRQNVLTFGQNPPKDQEVIVAKDSADKAISYLYDATIYEPIAYKKAMTYIDSGIKLFPERLDMRFGKIHILGESKDWDNFTVSIIKAVNESNKNQNNWKWTLNGPLPEKDSVNFFLSAIHDYQVVIYETGDDSLLKNMRDIALTVLKYHPDHAKTLTNVALTHMALGEGNEALPYLLKAEKLEPSDDIILTNLAHTYYLIGDIEQCIAYYEKAIEIGDEYAKRYSEERIQIIKAELENKK